MPPRTRERYERGQAIVIVAVVDGRSARHRGTRHRPRDVVDAPAAGAERRRSRPRSPRHGTSRTGPTSPRRWTPPPASTRRQNGFFEDDHGLRQRAHPSNRNLKVLVATERSSCRPVRREARDGPGRRDRTSTRRSSADLRPVRWRRSPPAPLRPGRPRAPTPIRWWPSIPTSCASGKIHGNGDITIEPVENPDTPGVPYSGGYVHINSTSATTGAFNNACGNGSGAFHHGGNAGAELTHATHVHPWHVPGFRRDGRQPRDGGSAADRRSVGGTRGPRQEDYPAGYCPRKQGSTIVYDLILPTRDGCAFQSRTG